MLGRDRAGQVITDGEVSVRFDKNGFAEFDAQFETVLDDIHIGSGRPDLHFKTANKRLYEAIQEDPGLAAGLGLSTEDVARLPAMRRPPDGYTWHHHQDVGRMQLVRSRVHDLAKPHTGGMAIWGGGYPRAVPKAVPK